MKENPVPKTGTAQFPKLERGANSRSQNWYKLFPKLERKQPFSTISRSHFWDILTYHVPTERKGHSMTEFQEHFIQPMVEQNVEYPLLFIEILANMAEDSPELQQFMIEALRRKAEWYQQQANATRTLIDLNDIAAKEGKKHREGDDQ